jgi:putative FmdB family regulatory protein
LPTYSYKCTECGTAFDIQQAFTDDSLTVCPNCGGKLRKIFAAVGVTFNGSGFYRTDSKADASKSKKTNAGESKSSDSKSSDSKSTDSSGSSASSSSDSGSQSGSTPSKAPATPKKAAG